MTFQLPALPYAKDALAPHISAETLNVHHGKHHNAYVVKLNGLIEGTDFAGKSLEDIITATANDDSKKGVFNNAAQIWNHTFFWHCLSPNSGAPSGALAKAIDDTFGSLDAFKAKFKEAAVGQFGSGWAWLVSENGTLKIVTTSNAGVPFTNGQKPLFTCDVWEHAYYIDFQNRRPDFVQTVLDELVNWDFVAENFEG